jgi:RNA polymerase sigma-70 factor (ECF subfamily)
MTPESEAGRLYDLFGASLYRYALIVLANREAAEDVIQQVFLSLLDRGVGHIDDEERYLRRAVRNACYSALRYQKVRGGPSVDTALVEVPAEAPALDEEVRMTLEAAICQLPPDQREVIHLHLFEGRTFKEAAELTGEPLSTVASRYRYAIEKMKGMLSTKSNQ